VVEDDADLLLVIYPVYAHLIEGVDDERPGPVVEVCEVDGGLDELPFADLPSEGARDDLFDSRAAHCNYPAYRTPVEYF